MILCRQSNTQSHTTNWMAKINEVEKLMLLLVDFVQITLLQVSPVELTSISFSVLWKRKEKYSKKKQPDFWWLELHIIVKETNTVRNKLFPCKIPLWWQNISVSLWLLTVIVILLFDFLKRTILTFIQIGFAREMWALNTNPQLCY